MGDCISVATFFATTGTYCTFQALRTLIQVALRRHRAHHQRRRENRILKALAALPAPNFPRLRALALFGRRTPDAGREASHHAGVQKPAHVWTWSQ
jgi:hypothetical protein